MKTLRDTLISSMYTSMYKHGYHATNLNDVLLQADTSKGGMYHYFDSKQTLALVAIETYVGDYIHRYWEVPLEKSENPLQTLIEQVRNVAHLKRIESFGIDFRYGCPLNNFIQELSMTDETFGGLLNALFMRWEGAIIQAFTRIRKELKIDVNIAHAASFIIASIEGSFTYAKVHHGERSIQPMMEELIVFIHSLIR